MKIPTRPSSSPAAGKERVPQSCEEPNRHAAVATTRLHPLRGRAAAGAATPGGLRPPYVTAPAALLILIDAPCSSCLSRGRLRRHYGYLVSTAAGFYPFGILRREAFAEERDIDSVKALSDP